MNEDFSMLKKIGIDPDDPESVEKGYNNMMDLYSNKGLSEATAKEKAEIAKELKQTMSDDEVEMLKDRLNDAQGPDVEILEQASKDAEEDKEGYETVATVSVNPETGEQTTVSTDESPYITESFDEFIANHANDEIDMSVNDKAVEKVLKESLHLDVASDELIDFMAALRSYQDKTMTATEVYKFMPKSLQNFISQRLSDSGISMTEYAKYRTALIKQIIDNLIEDAAFDKYIIDMNNQLEEVYTEFGRETNKFYDESIQEKIDTIQEILDNNEEPSEERRAALQEILDGLNDSMNLTELKEASKRIKVKRFDFEKPDRFISTFNSKYINSKFNIQDIKIAIRVLHFRCGFSKSESLLFGAVFAKFCQNYRPTVIREHVFMYYTLSNIISLAAAKEYSEIGQKIVDNISEVINNAKQRNAGTIPAEEAS